MLPRWTVVGDRLGTWADDAAVSGASSWREALDACGSPTALDAPSEVFGSGEELIVSYL